MYRRINVVKRMKNNLYTIFILTIQQIINNFGLYNTKSICSVFTDKDPEKCKNNLLYKLSYCQTNHYHAMSKFFLICSHLVLMHSMI